MRIEITRVQVKDNPEVVPSQTGGHRVFVEVGPADPRGAGVDFPITLGDLETLRSAIETNVNAAITAHGATAQPNWWYSAHAGCQDCPCSPGFMAEGTGPGKWVFVDVTVAI